MPRWRCSLPCRRAERATTLSRNTVIYGTLDFPAGKSTLDLVVSCPQQWRLRVSAGWCYVLGADVLNEPCEGKTFKIGVDGNNSLEGP